MVNEAAPYARTGKLLLAAGAAIALLPVARATALESDYTVRTLHFDAVVGPDDNQHCDVVGDLYEPGDASATHREPAVLTTNGFGGSKDDQASMAKALVQRGYIVLSYSGLGFGGSGCRISLDNPDYDGKAASRLVDFLAGSRKAKDGTALNDVLLDGPNDPRVGLIGGSYGGESQFAVAGRDRRIDAIVPIVTWHDLRYSTFPNNELTADGTVTTEPGVAKVLWSAGFFFEGAFDAVHNAVHDATQDATQDGAQNSTQDDGDNLRADSDKLLGCPNFPSAVCQALAEGLMYGVPRRATTTYLAQSSVASYMDKIKAPTLLIQGQTDSLFNLQESAATYRQLAAQRTPVKMIWMSYGHSGGVVPGEFDFSDPDHSYVSRRALAWLDHYLKRDGSGTGPRFAYFRDWVSYSGDAGPAYGTAAKFPLDGRRRFYLSGSNALVSSRDQVRPGAARYVNLPGGVPSSFSEASAVQGKLVPNTLQPFDGPGTYAGWTSGPLASPLVVVGSPTLEVRLDSPAAARAQRSGTAHRLVLFAKLYDVAPNGRQTLVHRLVSPVRVVDVRKPLSVQLPGIVHRFPAGDRLRVVIAASDASYLGNRILLPVAVPTSPGDPGVLTLPTS